MGKESLVALLHALSGAGALVVCLYAETDLFVSVRLIKPLGLGVFAAGMLIFVVSVVYLKRAFFGNVEPITDRLITDGPYRLVRHPLYLGMFVATTGLAVAFRSLWGMLITLIIFVPLGLWRAMLEEKALEQRFGKVWDDYTRHTHFAFPPLY